MKIHTTIKQFVCISMLALLPFCLKAQHPENPGWHLKDLKTDHVFGVSMEKTYNELIKDKKGKPVIVAVLDGGVDVEHEDLKPVIWTNEKEIPDNGIDDDQNGFIDDIHGWNFFTSMANGDEEFDIRELSKQKNNAAQMQSLEQKLLAVKNKIKKAAEDKETLQQMISRINKSSPTSDDFKDLVVKNDNEAVLQKQMVNGLKYSTDFLKYKLQQFDRTVSHYNMELSYYEKQDYSLLTGGPTSFHGTHIAGIIAAVRNNGKGINGVANQVRIMVVRTIPGIKPEGVEQDFAPTMMTKEAMEGREAFKVMAKAIRYAVDNGAKVINMSFGDSGTLSVPVFTEAVKYGMSKDVLFIHASGNKSVNLDREGTFADIRKPDGVELSSAWIEVGASGLKDDKMLPAHFSNYGKITVDVYAPGVDIYSTAPRSGYLIDSGTSMAAPVVSGIAAMLRAYYPKLTAAQVKDIIMASVTKAEALTERCVSGGVVNAYEAFKMAAEY